MSEKPPIPSNVIQSSGSQGFSTYLKSLNRHLSSPEGKGDALTRVLSKLREAGFMTSPALLSETGLGISEFFKIVSTMDEAELVVITKGTDGETIRLTPAGQKFAESSGDPA